MSRRLHYYHQLLNFLSCKTFISTRVNNYLIFVCLLSFLCSYYYFTPEHWASGVKLSTFKHISNMSVSPLSWRCPPWSAKLLLQRGWLVFAHCTSVFLALIALYAHPGDYLHFLWGPCFLDARFFSLSFIPLFVGKYPPRNFLNKRNMGK